jgi:hypothetical protein
MLRSSPYSGFQFNLSSKVIWTAKKSFAPIDLFRVSILKRTNERFVVFPPTGREFLPVGGRRQLVCSISAGRQGIPASRRAAAASLCPGLGRQL